MEILCHRGLWNDIDPKNSRNAFLNALYSYGC
jgi:hypothetical protein